MPDTGFSGDAVNGDDMILPYELYAPSVSPNPRKGSRHASETTPNNNKCRTILLIHTAFSAVGGLEYRDAGITTPLAKAGYSVLALDLPSHARASSIVPLTLDDAVRRVAATVRKVTMAAISSPAGADQVDEAGSAAAGDVRVHAVGVSLGAHVAAAFAARHPELVATLFVSGFALFRPDFLGLRIVSSVAKWTVGSAEALVAYMMNWKAPSAQLIEDVTNIIVSDWKIERIKCPTLIFVATKFPSGDNVRDAQRLLGCVTLDGDWNGHHERRSLIVKRRVPHPWHISDAPLFVEMVLAWIEGRRLPDEGKESEVIGVIP